MDKTPSYREVELNYRKLYGKLFASLIALFGSVHTTLIEDAIQNAFYKSLKTWKPYRLPDNPLSWLFIVCKNDILNQLRKNHRESSAYNTIDPLAIEEAAGQTDLRLETLLLIANLDHISVKSKILFSLKNIFGLSVREIHQSTLIREDAIYKNVKRAQNKVINQRKADFPVQNNAKSNLPIIYEILYSVFNIGFDKPSKNDKSSTNVDISLEASALTKQLSEKYPNPESKNLLSLFCLHMARAEGKFGAGELITFFDQDRGYWNEKLIQLGLTYLTKPSVLDRYYLEALITSMHMVTENHDQDHWSRISECYQLLEKVNSSPIIKINHAYIIFKIGQEVEAHSKLMQAKEQLPEDHFYLQMVEAELVRKTNPKRSKKLLLNSLKMTDQHFRKKLIRAKIDKIFEQDTL